MLLKVKFLGHEIGYNTMKPIHSKIAAIQKIPSPIGKVALMSFIGALNFYTKIIEKLHINLKPFYDLLHENNPWKWTDEHESLFQKLKMSLTSETELTIPNTKHPFFITVDASLIGLGAVLFQLNEQNKMKVISYNSRILNPQEQKLSTLDREFLGIVHALQIYEFLIIASPHPIHIFTNHKPLLHCFTKKGNLSPRFYRAQMQLTKFSKLKIIHTPGKNLSVADMLSRSFTKAELQLNQLKHKQLPPQIDFALLQDNTLKPVHYLIKHEENLPHQKYDSHPNLADYGTDQFSIRINDKGNDIVVKPLQSFSFNSINPFQTKFKTPIKKNNKTLHQQSLLLNCTDVTSDDEDHIYTRIPKSDSSFLHDTTLQTENYCTLNQLTRTTSQKSVSAINVQPNLPSLTHCQQTIPFYDTPFFSRFLRLFKTVFNKLHENSHTGIKITYNTFAQYYYIPVVEKWLSIFIHDCIECQRNKHFNMKIQTAPTQSFSEHAPSFNYRISMDTKGPINPPSHNKSYIHVIIDAFSHFVVTVPIKSINVKTAIKTLLHHWIVKFGPPIYLVTDRGSEYVNKEMAHLCTLM